MFKYDRMRLLLWLPPLCLKKNVEHKLSIQRCYRMSFQDYQVNIQILGSPLVSVQNHFLVA